MGSCAVVAEPLTHGDVFCEYPVGEWVQALDGGMCEKCDRLGNHLFRRAA